MTVRYRLGNIRRLLKEGFTEGELRDFCFDTPDFRAVYDRLAENTSPDGIVRQILGHADRTENIEFLLDWAREKNPIKYNLYQPYHYSVRILLVDDNPDWCEQFGSLLQEQGRGYEVVTTTSKEEAQRHIRNDEPYNLVIIDMRLDESDEENSEGVTLGFWLRDNGYKTPIIIISSYSIDAKLVKYMVLRPFQFVSVEKWKIGSGEVDDLLHQVKLALLP